MRNQKIYNCDGKYCGEAKDNWIVKKVDPSIHKLISPPGWATDKAHIELLQNEGGSGLRLILPDGEILEASLEMFQKKGRVIERGELAPQIQLVDRFWTSNKKTDADAWQTKFPMI